MNGVEKEKIDSLKQMAKRMRLTALKMALEAGKNGAHIGPAMSCMEIFAVLYGEILQFRLSEPEWAERDRFIASKAHCVLAHYTALAEVGFISSEELCSFEKNGGDLAGHPAADLSKGLEYSGGSLGQALPVGVGMALDAKQKGRGHRIFILLGDGECDEGSNWEAFLTAAHYHLDNLVVILDKNQLQCDGTTDEILRLGNFKKKLNAFDWFVEEIDGHNIEELIASLRFRPKDQPYLVIANTIKGKGISFMEGVREWHHACLSQQQYWQAIEEIRKEDEVI